MFARYILKDSVIQDAFLSKLHCFYTSTMYISKSFFDKGLSIYHFISGQPFDIKNTIQLSAGQADKDLFKVPPSKMVPTDYALGLMCHHATL